MLYSIRECRNFLVVKKKKIFAKPFSCSKVSIDKIFRCPGCLYQMTKYIFKVCENYDD